MRRVRHAVIDAVAAAVAATAAAMAVAVAAVALGGCGGGTSGPDAGPGGPDATLGTTCEPGDIVATIRASPEPGASGPWGSQVEALVLAARAIELQAVTDEAAGCRYYGAQPALCEPACTGGELCDIHGACVAYDAPVDAGTITITGTTPTVTLEPNQFHTYYSQESLPGLFAPGDAIEVDVEGAGAIAGFHLATLGIPVLALPTTELTAVEHVGLTMTWTPSDVAGAELVLHLDNDHHAGPESIECRVPASAGTLTVPAAILDQLILAGEAGIGTYIENAYAVLRRRSTVQTGRGCAVFEAASAQFVQVETIRDE